MKAAFTFEYEDLLEHIEKILSMNGMRPCVSEDGSKRIRFDSKKKQVVVECEAVPFPSTCPFCQSGVHQEATTKNDDSTTNEEALDDTTKKIDDPQANDVESEENAPMSLAQLKAQSRALGRKEGPIKVNIQRGAEAHAALAQPSRLPGESTEPPGDGEDF